MTGHSWFLSHDRQLWITFDWVSEPTRWVCITPRSYFAFNWEELLERACKEEDVLSRWMEGTSQTSLVLMRLPVWRTQTPAPGKCHSSFLDMMLFIPSSNADTNRFLKSEYMDNKSEDISDGAEDTKEYWEEEIEFLEARLRGVGEIDAEDRSSVKRHWRLPSKSCFSDPTLSPCSPARVLF